MPFSKVCSGICLALCLFSFAGCDREKLEVKKENIGDAELAYYTRGNGDPLIMIMGFRGTMSAWDPGLLSALEKNYTLILFDNRGAGLSSDQGENELTISQMADDTAKLIKALGYAKTNVLGWSMGSRVAMELSINHPEVVKNVILCSPNPGGKHQVLRKSDAYTALTSKDVSQKDALSLIFPNTTAGNLASASFVIRLTNAMLQGTVPNDLDISQKTIDRQIHALKLWDEDNEIYEKLSGIKTPTLVAGGIDDVLSQPENVQIIASRIPFAWSAYFPGAGHAFLSQDYERFAELVTLFIESNQ